MIEAMIQPQDRLGFTLFFAAIVHAIVILGVGFKQSLEPESPSHSLDVVLVQTEALTTPDDADLIAQANQQASGSSDSQDRPSSQFTGPSPIDTEGVSPEVTPATPIATPKPEESTHIVRQDSDYTIVSEDKHRPEKEQDSSNSTNETQRNLEIARLTAELAEKENHYSRRPRINYVDTLSAKSAIEANYLKAWVDKVERVGNLNYPDEARRKKLGGSLIMHVLLNNDGKIIRLKISTRSGQQVLDDSALRTVRLAAPYQPFPKEMREEYDQLMITRTWVFQAGKNLTTK